VVEAIRDVMRKTGVGATEPVCFVDLCCGKSLTSALLTLLFPHAKVVGVDRMTDRSAPHFFGNVHHCGSPAATCTMHCSSLAATCTMHCGSPAATCTMHCSSLAATCTMHCSSLAATCTMHCSSLAATCTMHCSSLDVNTMH
jgi:hypothetical protein